MVNKLEAHRRQVTDARCTYALPDPRKLKRHENQHQDALYEAFICGDQAGCYAKHPRNPYPPGKRHTEWDRGFKLADPMGDHHGRNY